MTKKTIPSTSTSKEAIRWASTDVGGDLLGGLGADGGETQDDVSQDTGRRPGDAVEQEVGGRGVAGRRPLVREDALGQRSAQAAVLVQSERFQVLRQHHQVLTHLRPNGIL